MSYRIEYGSEGALRKPVKGKGRLVSVMAILCVLALVLGAMAVKHTGLGWVKEVILPGDPAVTAAALENMVESIRQGDSFADAVAAFCREIIQNADAI